MYFMKRRDFRNVHKLMMHAPIVMDAKKHKRFKSRAPMLSYTHLYVRIHFGVTIR